MSALLRVASGDARPAVEVHRLRKTYPAGIEAVRGIDFQVAPGEVFGLLGPNGAGKSTTIGMLTTTIKPTSGSARLAGLDVVRRPIAARSVSSVVFQESVLDKALTGRRNLDLHARLWGIPPSAAARRIAELAGSFGLSEVIGRPVDSLSGGQRRRLEIARALVSEPRVLFLDEPTVGLDTRIRYELLDLISGLRGRTGMTTLLTPHYLDEAERLCDRIAVMHQGAIVAMDRPDALLAGLGSELVELRVGKDPDGALAAMRARGLAARDAFAVGSTLTLPLGGHSAMTTITAAPAATSLARPRAPAGASRPAAWATLARRRISLSAHTPREILAPLATALLFAPALAKIIQATGGGGADYSTFVIVGTVGLLIPLTCTFAGIGVIVDRATGARRELLTAPIPRALIVLGNMAVAIGVSLLQVGALMTAGWLRGSHFHATPAGVGWFTGAVLAFTVFMYGLAEILANRIPTQEEYVGLTPVVAILPWFIAGALFPITALPAWLAGVARALPTTHVLALLRYGVLDRTGAGLHDIWGMTSTTTDAALSLLVLAGWAILITAAAIRAFTRSAVN